MWFKQKVNENFKKLQVFFRMEKVTHSGVILISSPDDNRVILSASLPHCGAILGSSPDQCGVFLGLVLLTAG
jgi:hypothetical protein